jgi:hypothetical protein
MVNQESDKASCPVSPDPVGKQHRESTGGSDLLGKDLSRDSTRHQDDK